MNIRAGNADRRRGIGREAKRVVKSVRKGREGEGTGGRQHGNGERKKNMESYRTEVREVKTYGGHERRKRKWLKREKKKD